MILYIYYHKKKTFIPYHYQQHNPILPLGKATLTILMDLRYDY
jgi:hypothetical protein